MASYKHNGNGRQNGHHAGRLHPENGRKNGRRGLPPSLLRRKEVKRSGWRLLMLLALSIIGTLVLFLLFTSVSFAVAYTQIAGKLKPRLEALKTHKSFQSSRIYDRHGTLLFEIFGEGRREPVPLDSISPHLINATIAVEDASFYENPGVDYLGILRATYQNIISRAEVSGASTITQQVVRNIILTPEERAYEKRYERKIKEIILAQELSNIYSKDQILELYLNEIPYGNLTYGIQAASKSYFGVNASELTLAQASLLAGLPQLPTYYNPIQYLEGNRLPGLRLGASWLDPSYELPDNTPPPKVRQISVLRQMVAEGYIDEAQARRAAAQDLIFADQEFSLLAPHFVFYVKEYLEQKYGSDVVAEGGLRITTTLDLELQNMAQEEAQRRIAELEAEERNIHNAAVVVLQPNTGQILAMVGSVGYTRTLATTTPGEEGNVLDGKVNVTTRQRQPGSALKPFTYLAGFEQNLRYRGPGDPPGLNPATIIWDVETRFPIRAAANDSNIDECEFPDAFWYCPHNFDLKWHGPMRPRMALANSLNMPAVKALKRTGVGNMIDLLHRAGVAPTSLSRGADFYGLSLTLGGGEVTPLDLATAYNTLASGGRYFPPTPILKITDARGQVLEEFTPIPLPTEPSLDTSRCVPPTIEEYAEGKRIPPGMQCIDPRLAFIITNMMSDNQARVPMFGSNSVISLNPPAAVKTGTTEDFRDAWASGFTPYVTITVWTGNNNNERTARVESVAGGGVIFARLMQRIRSHERLMTLLAEPFGGQVPSTFPSSFPGVERREVCSIPGPFGGPTSEFFISGMKHIKTDPEEAEKSEKVIAWEWAYGSLKDVSHLLSCEGADDLPPIPTEEPTPEITPTPELPPGIYLMPNLVGYGENQAKEILGQLGIKPEQIVVQYQSRSKLGDLFDQYPPYAVVSSLPPPGSLIDANTTIVLGIRSPADDGGRPQPTATPPPPAPKMPNLVGYGENQAREILYSLGIKPEQIIVDYQSRSRLGDLFDQYPPYAVVSTSPPPGAPLNPSVTIILGVRSPEDDGGRPSP
ncbi:MAG: glycosyl transferase [Herpetosiphonaceae bacterium]|nr:MAG: glycosyl transferase [Herpetosiphonaceae bacterium]